MLRGSDAKYEGHLFQEGGRRPSVFPGTFPRPCAEGGRLPWHHAREPFCVEYAGLTHSCFSSLIRSEKMPEEAPSADDPLTPSEMTGGAEETAGIETRDSLHERIRTLRLWADHLEARLAKKTEQADTWRKRAEERKDRIDALRAKFEETTRSRRRSFWLRSLSRPTRPETPESLRLQPIRHPTEKIEPSSDPRLSRLIHPTIRLGVAASTSTPIPPLLERMNSVMIRDSSDAPQVRSVDVLVAVGPEGARLAQTLEATLEWMKDGNPTVAIDASMSAHPSVDSSNLEYFDENDDIFKAEADPDQPRVDQNLQPTLSAISQVSGSEWLASIAETVSAEPQLEKQERIAVSLLRQLRHESSARAVGEQFLQTSGVSVPNWRREALAALVSKRPDFVVEATNRIASQTYRPLRIAIGLHGPAMDAERVLRQRLAESEIPHMVTTFDSSTPQGACLNTLVEHSPGDVILKIDDDDWYSPVFIDDMMGALEFSGAAIVGKAAAFVRLLDGRFVLLRTNSYREVDHVVGPTITAHRWAWEEVRFPHRYERVDSKFLQAARAEGLRVVSHHPWDFCVIRHDRGHSWTASDDYFLSAGRLVDIDWEGICTS